MGDAFYGLVGALGGGLITSCAAYFGPLHVQRVALRRHQQEAEETLRQQREEAERSRRQNEIALEEARSAARIADYQARRESETARIIRIRSTTRTWSEFLIEIHQNLTSQIPVDLNRFDEEIQRIRADAQSALDDVLHDGIWIQQSAYGAYTVQGNGEHIAFNVLTRATSVARSDIINGLNHNRYLSLGSLLDEVETARGSLAQTLLNRIEQIIDREPPPLPLGYFGSATPDDHAG
ncbi:hypothetical protein [Streptomyces sp. NPDC051636]|uniref:hypothetical protein n=1 Tax=Streptomyces sp. NPDC051636 TaxID=3365663 RepID=UPI003790A0D7